MSDFACLQIAAQDLQESAKSQTGNQEYGCAGGLIRRITELLNNTQRLLNTNDNSEFQARFATLKQAAADQVARGADASAIVQTLNSLQTDINSRVQERVDMREYRKSNLATAIARLESVLKVRTEDLSSADYSSYSAKVCDLKTKSSQKKNAGEEAMERFTQEAHDLEMQILSRDIYSPQKGSLTVTKDEPPDQKDEEEDAGLAAGSGGKQPSGAGGPLPATNLMPPRKSPLPLPKLIEFIENKLIEFHEKQQIGSFDMDSFTARLLAQKRNLHVMLSKTGRLSARQEALLRQELERLLKDLSDQVSGKN